MYISVVDYQKIIKLDVVHLLKQQTIELIYCLAMYVCKLTNTHNEVSGLWNLCSKNGVCNPY